MDYFNISTREGAISAGNYFNAEDLGLLMGGVPTYREGPEIISGIYYLSGISEFDEFLNYGSMAEQSALIEFSFYKNFEFLISIKNAQKGVIICIPKANIAKILISDNSVGLRKGRPLISGPGLLGFIGREVSKKLVAIKPETVHGINYCICFDNGREIKFFSPFPQYIDVLEFIQEHLKI